MRQFEIAKKVEDGIKIPMYEHVKMPVYKTRHSAGTDIFCAEEVVVPAHSLGRVHTGLKVKMAHNEALFLYNRSSNPSKRGLILANGVGVIDADYYGNPDNDGEIMMEFYNITDTDITVKPHTTKVACFL